MRNPFIAAVLAMALASQMQRNTFYGGNNGHGKARQKGKRGESGDKLSRKALNKQIGLRWN